MKILGIDPGLNRTGLGLLEFKDDQIIEYEYLLIENPGKEEIHLKLLKIFNETQIFVKKFQPDFFILEESFYGKNVKTTMKLSYVRGIILLIAALNNKKFFEYSPLKIKETLVGFGRATKEQVRYMVKKELKTEKDFQLDVSDAFAVAFCHKYSYSNLLNLTYYDS